MKNTQHPADAGMENIHRQDKKNTNNNSKSKPRPYKKNIDQPQEQKPSQYNIDPNCLSSAPLTKTTELQGPVGNKIQVIIQDFSSIGQEYVGHKLKQDITMLLVLAQKLDKICREKRKENKNPEIFEAILSDILSYLENLWNMLHGYCPFPRRQNGLNDVQSSLNHQNSKPHISQNPPPTPHSPALDMRDKWLTLTEAAKMLAVHRGTISRWANQGILRHNGQRGAKRRFSLSSVLLLKQDIDTRNQRRDDIDEQKDKRRMDRFL